MDVLTLTISYICIYANYTAHNIVSGNYLQLQSHYFVSDAISFH